MNEPNTETSRCPHVVEFTGNDIIVRNLFSVSTCAWDQLKGGPEYSSSTLLGRPGLILYISSSKEAAQVIASIIRGALPADIPLSELGPAHWQTAQQDFMEKMDSLFSDSPDSLRELN